MSIRAGDGLRPRTGWSPCRLASSCLLAGAVSATPSGRPLERAEARQRKGVIPKRIGMWLGSHPIRHQPQHGRAVPRSADAIA